MWKNAIALVPAIKISGYGEARSVVVVVDASR